MGLNKVCQDGKIFQNLTSVPKSLLSTFEYVKNNIFITPLGHKKSKVHCMSMEAEDYV